MQKLINDVFYCTNGKHPTCKHQKSLTCKENIAVYHYDLTYSHYGWIFDDKKGRFFDKNNELSSAYFENISKGVLKFVRIKMNTNEQTIFIQTYKTLQQSIPGFELL